MFNLNTTAHAVWSERHCFCQGWIYRMRARTPTGTFLFQPGGIIHCLQITLVGGLGKEAQKFTRLGSLTPSWSLLSPPQRGLLPPPSIPNVLLQFIFIELSFASGLSVHVCCLSPLLKGGDFGDSLLYSQHQKSCQVHSRTSSINRHSVNEGL